MSHTNSKDIAANGSKRRKKKNRKEKKNAEDERNKRLAQLISSGNDRSLPDNVKIEYVNQTQPDLEHTEFANYASIFSRFASNAVRSFGANEDEEDDLTEEGKAKTSTDEIGPKDTRRKDKDDVVIVSRPDDDLDSDSDRDIEMDSSNGSDSDSDEKEDGTKHSVSRKQQKKSRMSVAELKQVAPRPEVVEWTDVSARDPGLLVTIKATRNTVPVPMHWSQKKGYLQYKRGMEKPPFDLPDFIKATGIMEMREAVKDKEDEKKAKSTARERMRPKMNKLTLDYQRLHDAFFRFQTAPKNLSGHGDLYYEGKESDVTYNFTPGVLSDSLKVALNIPPLAPPPWLLNMQRHGPPPSYSNLIIPGLNAPIPPGAQWGYHPGGWGRPPVDEFGRPLYGDVFTTNVDANAAMQASAMAEQSGPRKYWGDLEILESSDEEEEANESDIEQEKAAEDMKGEEIEAEAQGAVPAAKELTDEQLRSGLASIPSGLETPSVIQLRKQPAGETKEANKQLYTILPEKETPQLEGIMGSTFTYDMSQALDPSKRQQAAATGKKSLRKEKPMGKGLDITLDASELEGLDAEKLKAKYEEAAVSKSSGPGGAAQEDLSDMVAEHAATQSRKRKTPAPASILKKKAKEYKF
ncbi:hypothetical protein GGI25_000109 [Coemansia spiralis]|uniref:PSP proline-rich domain-containing protein n=2 Tax=Coemansia TaxID=4863 RepID=A0A9W8GD90_9FUNG|nr:hypothetical protein EDC05_002754 [Coemansia umbellata]KAJ2620298.1 hypothetical protein GGI26_005122 [Coemansia sp. RSA 1358]KAJ2681154.1 hypothetical protein GGI25_000109 [Coemansia spiralis]